jgi:adenylate cyclase
MYSRAATPPLGVVAIAAIDDPSIKALGRWPWSRRVFADLLDSLRRYYNVRVICMDMLLADPDYSGSPVNARPVGASAGLVTPNDQAFADAIKNAGNVLVGLSFKLDQQQKRAEHLSGFSDAPFSIAPNAYAMVRLGPQDHLPVGKAYLPLLDVIARSARGIGYVNIEPDADSIVRSEPMAIGFGDSYYLPLSLAAVSAYDGNSALSMRSDPYGRLQISVGNRRIPVYENGQMMIRYRGTGATFPTYSVSDIIQQKVARDALADKIVLIGATATGLEDLKSTPLDSDEPGVEVHATIIDDILRGDFLVRSGVGGRELFFALAMGLTSVFISTYLGAAMAGIAEIVMTLSYLVYAQLLLLHEHEIVGVFVPVLVALATYTILGFYRYLTEGREKRQLRNVFEHYLHPEVIKAVVENPGQLRLGGERHRLTIMFTDIVDFTHRAEKADPEELVNLLNDYTTAMTDFVLESRGVVDKLMGDGMMAFWGAPMEIVNPSKAAIDCGLAMLSRLQQMRKEDPRFHELYIGIGIHSGEAILGNFGSARHFDYSAIGDAVNFASRLEGLTRYFKVPLLVSAATLAEAGAQQYACREIGLVKVRGKSEPVEIVEVVGHRALFENDGAFYRAYADALDLARAGSWQDALSSLRLLYEQRPGDEVTRLCIESLSINREMDHNHVLFEFDTK